MLKQIITQGGIGKMLEVYFYYALQFAVVSLLDLRL